MYCPIKGFTLTKNQAVYRRELAEKDTVVYFPRPEHVGNRIRFRDGAAFEVVAADQSAIPEIKYPFVYQNYHDPKLAELKERLKLDEKLDSALTGFERISALYRISRFEILDEMSAWPLPDFWDFVGYSIPNHNTHGACAETSHRFVCIASAYGYIARKVNFGRNDEDKSLPHVCTEIWCDELQKWVFWDALVPYYFEDIETGIPLSLAEIVDRNLDERLDSVRIHSWRELRGDGMADKLVTVEYADRKGTSVENRWPDRFYWAAIYMGNDHLSMSGLRFNHNVCLIMRPQLDEDHWHEGGRYSRYYEHKCFQEVWDDHNLYMPQNQVEINIADTPDGPVLALAEFTPNFDHLEVRFDGGDWERRKALSPLRLADKTEIEARTVNKAGMCGKPVRVTLARTSAEGKS